MEESGRRQADHEYRASSWDWRIPREVLRGVFPWRGWDLTTASGKAFSAKYGDNPGLAYLSVAGSGRQAVVPTASLLLLFHRFILTITGKASDGLVTVDSAQRGDV